MNIPSTKIQAPTVTVSDPESRGPATSGSAMVDGHLPPPLTALVTDDLETTLALAMLQQKQTQRQTNDQQSLQSAKAEQDADDRKVSEMRKLADDTRAEGIAGAVFDGIGAVATGVSAGLQFRGDTDKTLAESTSSVSAKAKEDAGAIIRDAGLVRAAGESFAATGKLVSAQYRGAQEDDRADMAVADKDIDRAKSAADSASTASKQAQDDMRDTIAAIRSYTQAKTQMQQAAIIRG